MRVRASCEFEHEFLPLFFGLTDHFIMTACISGFGQFIDISGINLADSLTSVINLVIKTVDFGPLWTAAAFGTMTCIGNKDGAVRFWDARTA